MQIRKHIYIVDTLERHLFYSGIATITMGIYFLLKKIIVPNLEQLLGLDLAIIFTFGMIYGVCFFLFNTLIWKMPLLHQFNIIKTPNLNGTWKAKGESDGDDNSKPFEGEYRIQQDWTQFSIIGETATSKSASTSATMFVSVATDKSVTFTYRNQPKHNKEAVSTMQRHEGTMTMTLSADGQKLIGEYYNGRGRHTYGSVELTKVTQAKDQKKPEHLDKNQ